MEGCESLPKSGGQAFYGAKLGGNMLGLSCLVSSNGLMCFTNHKKIEPVCCEIDSIHE